MFKQVFGFLVLLQGLGAMKRFCDMDVSDRPSKVIHTYPQRFDSVELVDRVKRNREDADLEAERPRHRSFALNAWQMHEFSQTEVDKNNNVACESICDAIRSAFLKWKHNGVLSYCQSLDRIITATESSYKQIFTAIDQDNYPIIQRIFLGILSTEETNEFKQSVIMGILDCCSPNLEIAPPNVISMVEFLGCGTNGKFLVLLMQHLSDYIPASQLSIWMGSGMISDQLLLTILEFCQVTRGTLCMSIFQNRPVETLKAIARFVESVEERDISFAIVKGYPDSIIQALEAKLNRV